MAVYTNSTSHRQSNRGRKDWAPNETRNTEKKSYRPKPQDEIIKSKPVISPRADWYNTSLADLGQPSSKAIPPPALIEKLQNHASSLLEIENKAYAASNQNKSSAQKFTATIMTAGTLEDKVSALTLLVQESPLHGMRSLESLLGLAKKRSRNQALMAAAAVKDLLSQGAVLPDRKLRIFSKQPGLLAAMNDRPIWNIGQDLPNGLTEQHLIIWAFEDWLKKQYFEFLKILESWCADEVEYARSRAITYVWELLKDKPEQEENLLRLLVNKLGDTSRKIASRTSHLLLQLQISHPAMKRIIIDAVENECLFKPSQSTHAKYFSVITLNQTILGKADQVLASELLRIYFSLFVQLLKPLDKREETIKKAPVKQQGGGGVPGKAAAAKKAKLAEAAVVTEQELYDRMTAQVLTGVNRAFPYADSDSLNFTEQVDTIFRITHSSNFNTSIQALMLIQKISSQKHQSTDRFYRTLYESLHDPRLITSSKQVMYLNLLYTSLKSDVDAKRVQAFVKRLLQVLNLHDVPFIIGSLFLISKLEITFPALRRMISEPEIDPQDEEERFYDAADSTPLASTTSLSTPKSSSQELATKSTDEKREVYDARKRDPSHTNAHLSCLWDILPFLSHYHPSVSLFASSFLSDLPCPPRPDPATHTLMHFLDRFIYRNAKTKAGSGMRGQSIMQPATASQNTGALFTSSYETFMPVNSENFWSKDVGKVREDEVFFHQYFNSIGRKAKGGQDVKKRKGDEDDEDEDDEDDEGEEEIWKALVDSRPEVEGPGGESDDDFSDLEAMDDDWSDMDDLDGDEKDGSINDMDEGVEIADFPEGDESELLDLGEDVDDLGSEGDEVDLDDEDALLGSDDEIQSDLELAEAMDNEHVVATNKRSKNDEGGKKKKRKLKHLPTFASAEDYAKLLEDEPDDY